MWDLHQQILTVCENYEKKILCVTWIDKFGLTVQKFEQNNSMCHLDGQISCMCKK